MRAWTYPLYAIGVLLFAGMFFWLDYRRNGDLVGLVTWTAGPLAAGFTGFILFMRFRFRELFEYEKNAPASAIFSQQARHPDLPESLGSWPRGQLYLVEATGSGVSLRSNDGAVAFVPRDLIEKVEVDYVEYFSVGHAPAIVIRCADGTDLPLVPSSGLIPGHFASRRRTARLVNEFTRLLR